MGPKQALPKAQDLISFADAAQLLGVTRRTIERMVKDGRLTKYTLRVRSGRGRMPVRIDRNQVEQLRQAVVVAE